MRRVSVRHVTDSDPARLRKRNVNDQSVECFYKLCLTIPTLIGLSLAFFLLFLLSPRGESVSQYQKMIYSWNKNKIGEKMSDFDLNYKIMPYSDPKLLPLTTWHMEHTDGKTPLS